MSIYYQDEHVTLYHGDAATTLASLPSGSVDCIVTSPPYFGLRDYGVDGQVGAEASPAEFVAALVAVFREARRVLADDGTLWLNLGDSYASGGRKPSELPGKNLIGIPWRVAFALQDDGWILRNDIIWHKPNAGARTTHKNGKNPGDVWTIATQPFRGAHFATFPVARAERCAKAGCKHGGVVLDPFSGSGTAGLAALRHGRRFVGIDLNSDYLDLSLRTRLSGDAL